MGVSFFFNNILLGIGLAMDAFSVSVANGLHDPCMKRRNMCGIAGVFAAFQFMMPLIGWICVSTIAGYFKAFEVCIPWIALLLLGYIGGKMLIDGLRSHGESHEEAAVGLSGLLVQGVATSIDALSVGFTIADYPLTEALVACLLIGTVTFVICFVGLQLGKSVGTVLAGKAGIVGGAILIFIGLEIFIAGVL